MWLCQHEVFVQYFANKRGYLLYEGNLTRVLFNQSVRENLQALNKNKRRWGSHSLLIIFPGL